MDVPSDDSEYILERDDNMKNAEPGDDYDQLIPKKEMDSVINRVSKEPGDMTCASPDDFNST